MAGSADVLLPPPKQSNKAKWIGLIIVVLLATTITFAVLWAQEITKDPNEGYVDRSVKVCLTKECVSAAASLVRSMNATVDPCDDFYEFSCGLWNKTEPMPDDRPRWQVFDVLRRELLKNLRGDMSGDLAQKGDAILKSKTYYNSCVNSASRTNATKDLLKHLQAFYPELENWPYKEGDKIPNLLALMGTARKYGNSLGIFNNFLLSARDSPRDQVIQFDVPALTLDRTGLTDPKKEDLRRAYVKYGADLQKLLSIKSEGVLGEADETTATELFEKILGFEMLLASHTTKPEDIRDDNMLQNPFTLQQFATKFSFPSADITFWLNYFKNAWAGSDLSTKLTAETIVNVREPNFYLALNHLLSFNDTYKDQVFLANYFGWKVIEPLIARLDDDYRAIQGEFRAAQTGTTSDVPLWEKCIDVVNDQMPNAIGGLYVQNHFRQESKKELETMIKYLLKAFKEIVKESYWMTEDTRKKALEKAEKFTEVIGYPDYVMNSTAIDAEYKEFKVEDNYLTNYISGRQYQTHLEGKKFVEGIKPTDWISSPAIVNAFYEPTQNSITFPAGILQPPFLGYGYPQFWNFAAIGTVIGHEITHGFDDQGSLYDGDGKLNNWWDKQSRDAFTARAQGIIDQYTSYNYLGVQLNGKRNQGENIADNGGIRESYKGYKMYVEEVLNGKEEFRLPGFKDFTTDQMFYLSYAQIWCGDYRKAEMELQVNRAHSPGHYRIIGPLQNSEEFARAYRCDPNKYMNPANKKRVW